MKLLTLSSLNKVFKNKEPNFSEFTEYSALKNENFCFQIAFKAEAKEETEINLSVFSPISDCISLYLVKNIPAGKNGEERSDSFHYDLNLKEFPDLLMPIDGKFKVKKGEWHSVWVEVAPEEKKAGKKDIKVSFETAAGSFEKKFTLTILDDKLATHVSYKNPEGKIINVDHATMGNKAIAFVGTIGVQLGWLASQSDMLSEDWKIVENYIRNAVKHGVNMLLTPIFTPPLDTQVGGERPTVQLVGVTKKKGKYTFDFDNFERYVKLCLDCGVEAFEISHMFTQWGAAAAPKIMATVNGKEKRIFGWETTASGKAYTEFLEAFAKEFKKEVNKLGIKKRCWVHVSDEPNSEQLKTYKKAADIVRRLFPDFNSFDALSDIEFYRNGLIKTPVCAEDEADIFRKEVKNFWTYYCCTQISDFLPNRMFAQPSQRSRVLGVLLYKYDAQGFLQWGHNFWYSQYSKHPIDPFKVTDAGNAFPSGDAFVVYPGKDGQPLNSLRHKVILDAFQDLRALRLLESKTSRKYVLNLIEKGLDVPLSFRTYPHESQWLLNLREEINNEINKA